MKPMGRIAEAAAVKAPDVSMVNYEHFAGPPAPVDAAAVTPPERQFPPQGEPTQKASESTGGFYHYKGFQGIPFRSKSGKAPDIKANDPKKPVITADARVNILDLGNETDLKEYTRIWDGAAKGLYMISAEDRQWVPEAATWKVFLRWAVRYWEFPEE